jgi:hypothetical protein
VAVDGELSYATTVAVRSQQEEAAVAAPQALVPRDPHQGCGRTRPESRSARGREAADAPTSGDSSPRRGRSRGVVGSAPRPTLEVLVVWSDGCVMSQRPVHDIEASTSRATPPASDATPSRLELELHRPRVPQGLLDESRAE